MLAIVIPFYKIEFFNETLKSLSLQSDTRFKVYIGDDFSPADPKVLISNYKNLMDIDYQRFESNLGRISLSKQWERCISLINNEDWIVLLGDDDVVGIHFVASFYKSLNKVNLKNINVIRYASVLIDDNGQQLSHIYEHPIIELATDSFFRKMQNKSRGSLSEQIFRRSSYELNKFRDFPLAWFSDDMAWLDFTDCGFIYSINEEQVGIRVSDISISGNKENVEIKIMAKYLFYKSVIKDKLKCFNHKQQLFLLNSFEGIVKKQGEFNLKYLISNTYQYIRIMDYFSGIKFIRRYLLTKMNF